MNSDNQDRRIDYVEFQTVNKEDTKGFYSEFFGWEFIDFGPEYTSFTDGKMGGGFSVAKEVITGGPLIVLYAINLEMIEKRSKEKVEKLSKKLLSFLVDNAFMFPIQPETSWPSGPIDEQSSV